MRFTPLLALASGAAALSRGFNYGSLDLDGSPRTLEDFTNQFNAAKALQGTNGVFTSARLFTMIQAGTSGDLTSAIQAAINTDTSLLLGLWASAGQTSFDLELAALRYAIQTFGDKLSSRVVGISVGSEDLYRISPTGVINKSGAGANPATLVSYIGQVRSLIAGTVLSGASIGHVDTWTAYVNGSNSAVISAIDWVGVDAYPYFQNTQANGIENGESLFFDAYNATVGAAQGKDVWITETGWPVAGPESGAAVSGAKNAETYWKGVACRVLPSNINLFWFTLDDDQATSADVSFSLVNPSNLLGAPLYDLSCSSAATSSVAASSTAAKSSVIASSVASLVDHGVSSAVSSVATVISSVIPTPKPTVVTFSTVFSKAPTTTVEEECSETVVSTITVTGPAAPTTTAEEECSETAEPEVSTKTATPYATKSAAPAPSAVPSGKSCPTNLSGGYEYPHLIVPVDSANPSKAYGTSYNGKVSATVSSIFNFDIKSSDAGKTCSLVFLFPKQADLETSSYTFNGKGGLKITALKAPATEQTTYASSPAAVQSTTVESVAPGNSYLVESFACPAGDRIGFEFSSTGGLELEYFQDYNPSPIGAYITVC